MKSTSDSLSPPRRAPAATDAAAERLVAVGDAIHTESGVRLVLCHRHGQPQRLEAWPAETLAGHALDGAALPATGALVRHYKGGRYRMVGEAICGPSGQPLRLYRPEGCTEPTWARPAALFDQRLADGRRRFTALHPRPSPED